MPYTFPSFSNLGIYPLASSHLKYLNKAVNWQCAGTELAYTCMYSLCRGVPDGIMSLCVVGKNNHQIQLSKYYGIIVSNMRRTFCYMFVHDPACELANSTNSHKTVGQCVMLLEQDADSRRDGQ